MTRMLKKAFQEVSKLPVIEQNTVARWLLEEIEAEKKWDKTFAESENILEKLSDEAVLAHKQGKTKPLGLDDL